MKCHACQTVLASGASLLFCSADAPVHFPGSGFTFTPDTSSVKSFLPALVLFAAHLLLNTLSLSLGH